MMNSLENMSKCPTLWANGPDCLNIHQFPNKPQQPGPHRATQSPVTTGRYEILIYKARLCVRVSPSTPYARPYSI